VKAIEREKTKIKEEKVQLGTQLQDLASQVTHSAEREQELKGQLRKYGILFLQAHY